MRRHTLRPSETPRYGFSSVSTSFEAAMVIEAHNQEPGGRELDLLLHCSHIDAVPFTLEQAETARAAWRRFGKGNHPAGLNFCDCCAYALARTSDEPLLFKGNDLSQTGVSCARSGSSDRGTGPIS